MIISRMEYPRYYVTAVRRSGKTGGAAPRREEVATGELFTRIRSFVCIAARVRDK